MKKHLLAAAFLLSAMTSFGAGYMLNLQGLRQLAMGGTGTAWPWDASTIFYNPGGLARLKSIQVYASGLNIMPATAFGNQLNSGNTGSSVITAPQTFTPFNIYIGGPVQEDSRIALGLGIYTLAGVGLDWGNDWLGKYIVQSIQLKAICFQPTIAYRVSDFISVGAGFVYGIGSMDIRKALPIHGQLGPFYGPLYDEGEAHLHGNAAGQGFNLGAQFHISDKVQMGLTYRSQINMGIGGGSATFSVPKSLQSEFPNTLFDTQLPLPQVASIGIGVRPAERLTLQLDINYTGWNSYDSLRINFSKHTTSLQDMHEPRHYRNTVTPRVGAAYKLGRVVSIMAGGAFDPTPVTNGFVSPDLPDADRIVVTGGVAIKPMPRFTILTAFEGTSTVKRNGSYDYANFSGVYKTEAATIVLAFIIISKLNKIKTMRKIYIIGALTCLFAACRPSVRITTPPSAGSADFTNYLAIGNSLTAGYADNSLTSTGQLNSYPQRLFEQFQLVTKTKGTFVQPLLPGNYGYPGPKFVLGMTHSACTTDSSLGPVFYAGPLDSLGSWHYVSTVNNGQINNIGVPGIRVVDYLVANYAVIAKSQGAPYAMRFYHDPAGTPLQELQFRVNNLAPTFFTMWLGANDVLSYALNGGQGDGTGFALPIPGTNIYNSSDISPYAMFDTCYDKALNMAISTGSKGALINIPDISSLPFFTTVPAQGLMLARQGQADTLQLIYKATAWNKVFQQGANYFIIKDHNDQTRQAVPGELILMTVPQDSIRCAGWGSTTPIPKQYVITTDELQNIRNAVTAFNNFIQYEATLHHLAYIDMNSFMTTISTGYTYNGIKYTTEYISGGAFSLDGIHLTPRGYALVANQIIKGINGLPYKSNIPLLDVNKYHGIDFPTQ